MLIHRGLMTLREAGLPLGIREPYKGSGIVTPCKRSAAWGEAALIPTRPRGGRTLKFRVESLELRELHTLNIQHSTLNTYRPPRGRYLCMLVAHGQGRGLRINSPHGAGAAAHYTP